MFYHFSQVLFIALLFPMISSALVFRFGKDPNVLVAENCLIVAGTSVGATNSATLDECEKSCLKNERDKLIGTIGQFTIPTHTPVTLAEYILAAIATSTRLLDTYTWFPSIFQDIAQVNSRLYYFFIVTLSLLIVTWNQVVRVKYVLAKPKTI